MVPTCYEGWGRRLCGKHSLTRDAATTQECDLTAESPCHDGVVVEGIGKPWHASGKQEARLVGQAIALCGLSRFAVLRPADRRQKAIVCPTCDWRYTVGNREW